MEVHVGCGFKMMGKEAEMLRAKKQEPGQQLKKE
jgi:hypothetical protein